MIPYKIIPNMRQDYIHVIYPDGRIKNLNLSGFLEDLVEQNYGFFVSTRFGMVQLLPFKANTKNWS
ncbi:hypothetical protein J4421_05090 [Candidatus Woesearchaeota archaeon]|nr:hypothetical protein [Candidatus Woesearchaeota archaeon]